MRRRSRQQLIALAIVLVLTCVVGCGGSAKDVKVSRRASAVAASITPLATVSGVGQPTSSFRGDQNAFDDDDVRNQTGNGVNDKDGDYDNDKIEERANRGYYDSDDGPISEYGQSANARERDALIAVVKHYYKAAAAADGPTACTLIYPPLERSVPEDYGGSAAPRYLQGLRTCSAIMSRIFVHNHPQFVGSIAIIAARVQGQQAYVLVGSSTQPAGYITLERQGKAWTIVRFLAIPLP